MTFDWAQIAYIGSPLIVPFWAALNIVGGLVVVMWILAPTMCMFLEALRRQCTNIHLRLYERDVFIVHANPINYRV